MEPIRVSVLCTREEYLRFCARASFSLPQTAAGAVLLTLGGCGAAFGAISETAVVLLWMLGAALLLWEPLLLPFYRKGEAARRYDESRRLQEAVRLTFTEDSVTVDSRATRGTLPLSLVTQTVRTNEMLSLTFGRELTLLLPLRSLDDTQLAAITAALAK